MRNLGDLFVKDGAPGPAPAAAPEPTPAPEAPKVEPVVAQSSTADASTTGDVADAAPAAADSDKGATPGADEPRHVPLSALKDERKKRQEIEREVESLRRRLDEMQRPQAQAPAVPQAKNDDDNEWTEAEILRDLPGAFKKASAKQEQVFNERLRHQRYNSSEVVVRKLHSDFEETIAVWDHIAKANPSVCARVDADPLPLVAAYDICKNYLEQQKFTDPVLRDKHIRDEAEKLAQARVQELLNEQQRSATVASIPKSLTTARGSGGATAKASTWNGPKPLSQLFAR